MTDTDDNKIVWLFEGEEDKLNLFFNEQDPLIGINYTEESSSYNRISNLAEIGDLVWLVPRGDRPGRAGVIESEFYTVKEYPEQRRKIEWKSSDLFLNKSPQIPAVLVRYSKVSVNGSFAQMHDSNAIDEVRKLCGLEPLNELYFEKDLVINFNDYLAKLFPSEDTTEINFVKPWLEEMGYRVELPESKINFAWDMKAFKRGVGTFLVQVKHSSDIKDKNVLNLVEEAINLNIEAWWISLGLIDSNRKELLENKYDILEIWDAEDIYSEFTTSYNDYSRNFKDIIPLKWSLIPKLNV